MNAPVFNQFEHFPETLPNEQGYIADGLQRAEMHANADASTPLTPDIARHNPVAPEQVAATPEKLGGHARVWAAHNLMLQLRQNHPAFPNSEVIEPTTIPRGTYGDRIDPYHWN